MAAPTGHPVVVYVGGYGRSGSSVLDSLLADRLGALGGGELCNLFSWAADGRDCSCGLPVTRCPVWAPVVERVCAETGRSLGELVPVLDDAERRHGNAQVWTAAWSTVFESLAEAGTTVIVDSSKTAGGRRRAVLLAELAGTRVALFVHLHRSLPAVLRSRQRGGNLALEDGSRAGGGARGAARALVGWVTANRSACRQGTSAERAVSLDYDTFAADPEAALARIEAVLRELGAPLDTTRSPGRHAIAGNRVLRSGWDGSVTVDAAWRDELGPAWRVLGQVVQAATAAAGWLPR